MAKEPWEIKYYDELPIAEKEAIAQRADKATAEYIKTLPEYQSAIAEYNRWKKGEGKYIFGTAGKLSAAIAIYQEHYPRSLEQEVLKDYPELAVKSTEAAINDAIIRAGSKYVKDMRKFLEDVKGKSVAEVVAMYPELVGETAPLGYVPIQAKIPKRKQKSHKRPSSSVGVKGLRR